MTKYSSVKYLSLRLLPRASTSSARESNDNGIKVAVIGAGPSGLSAAYFLAKAGFDVTILEKEMNAGGIVQNVLPRFRLPKEAIEKDIEFIEKHGIRFVFGFDPNFPIDKLKKEGYKYIDTLGNAHTEIFVYGSDGMYNISTNGFPTTVPTTYTIGAKSNGPTSMHFNTFGAIQASDSLQSGTIKITKAGAVDDLIEGNFSGTSYSGIAVSGVFSVPRNPDN